jgi:hypothetical protein
MTFLTGTTVRFTMDNLGCIDQSGLNRDRSVNSGDLGRVLGPAADEGWFLVEPAKYPGAICPVDEDMIEVAR